MATTVASASGPIAKRKASTAGLAGHGRTVKRRAPKACQCCRARKVRCDVVDSGGPCTNCRLDEVTCTVTDSKRRRQKPRASGDADQSPVSSAEGQEEHHEFSSYEDVRGSHEVPSLLGDFMTDTSFPGTLDFELNHHEPHMLYQTQGHRLSWEERRDRMSTSQHHVSFAQSPSQLSVAPQSTYDLPHLSYMRTVLPSFIRPLPPRMLADDIDYLEKRGALTIPDARLRRELLRSYVQYVHPYMPLLELLDFLNAIEGEDGTSTVSLLLFQAVMFAGAAFVDSRYLIEQGFESRKAARKALFQRARLLYDFDYELDRITLVQSLLLMTYWYETPDDQKDTWHWMGVSLSLAHTIGLHRNPEKSSMDVSQQRLWKRVWWCCFMRDRLIALGMRRPPRIKNEDCDVPMLVLDDFEREALSPKVIRMLGGCPVMEDPAKRRALATMCVEKAKLCLCISHVIAAQYSVLAHKIGSTTETTMMLVPKKLTSETRDVMLCDQELDQWYDEVPEEAHYRTPRPEERMKSNEADVLAVHRALLRMVYLSTSSALHRPQVLSTAQSPSVTADLHELSRRKVRVAASEITGIAQDLANLDLVRFLPTTGVTVLLPAVIIHLLDIKSSDPSIRSSSLRQLSQCMQVLQRLREMYASADFATSFLEAAIRKANIDIAVDGSRAKPATPRRTPSFMSHDSTMGHARLTPPPEGYAKNFFSHLTLAQGELSMFSSVTPPRSDSTTSILSMGGSPSVANKVDTGYEGARSTNEFDIFLNFEAGADVFSAEDSLGSYFDVDWMASIPGETAPSGVMDGGPGVTGDLEIDLGIMADD